MRLLCYIMETDYTEALTPICISLTNLAENQIHGKDTEAGIAGKSKHGGWHPWVSWWEWLPVPVTLVTDRPNFPFSRKGLESSLPCLERGSKPSDVLLVAHSSCPCLPSTHHGQGREGAPDPSFSCGLSGSLPCPASLSHLEEL